MRSITGMTSIARLLRPLIGDVRQETKRMAVLGFDVGGAHLKAARVEGGRVVAAAEIACPLWQGVERLDDAVAQAIAHVGTAPVSAVTMTGELCDIFSSRS